MLEWLLAPPAATAALADLQRDEIQSCADPVSMLD
jgi:hypothetical protein